MTKFYVGKAALEKFYIDEQGEAAKTTPDPLIRLLDAIGIDPIASRHNCLCWSVTQRTIMDGKLRRFNLRFRSSRRRGFVVVSRWYPGNFASFLECTRMREDCQRWWPDIRSFSIADDNIFGFCLHSDGIALSPGHIVKTMNTTSSEDKENASNATAKNLASELIVQNRQYLKSRSFRDNAAVIVVLDKQYNDR
ncbi:hypothetical protein OSTOST_08003 [Ostertagia ostertagi]